MSDFKIAFKYSLPVCFGYLFLGAAYAILLMDYGYPLYLAVLSSVFVYSGSMQFALVPLMASGASFGLIALTTLMVNARMLFYGLAFTQSFKKMGWKFPYMIFSLSDETFSILLGIHQTRKDLSANVSFFIALLDHSYWIVGTLIGGIIGQILPFSTQGIDFSMTALFVVIVVNQWQQSDRHFPFFLGGIVGVLALILAGPKFFLIPALFTTLVCLILIAEWAKLKERREVTGK